MKKKEKKQNYFFTAASSLIYNGKTFITLYILYIFLLINNYIFYFISILFVFIF